MNQFQDRVPEAPPTDHQQTDHRTVLPGVRARQGVTGHRVRYVLGFGLAGAILVLAIAHIVYFASQLGSWRFSRIRACARAVICVSHAGSDCEQCASVEMGGATRGVAPAIAC
jgi:hypothetical protein